MIDLERGIVKGLSAQGLHPCGETRLKFRHCSTKSAYEDGGDYDSHSLDAQCFGAVVFAFHKAIGNARRRKVKEGQNFLSPIPKSREGFSQVIEDERLKVFLHKTRSYLCDFRVLALIWSCSS